MSERALTVVFSTPSSFLAVCSNWCVDIMPHLSTLTLEHEPPCKMGIQHRDIGFFSDQSIGYQYAGQVSSAMPLSSAPIIQWLIGQVNKSLGTHFNGALVNRYRDGTKYIGAHSDDEKGLESGPNKVVGVSFGATRTFRIRDKKSGNIVYNYEWESGTLVIMGGDFQKEFKHEIPQQKLVTGERISVTFRCHTK